ncbi:MAG: hypothetical protein OXO54_10310 [Chloroflexota bacterium]|nr:hypothetical protein [Chloroflexota bacterium]
MTRRVRIALSMVVAAVAAFGLATPALAQWPTTCVDLNDIVEAHLGNEGNVGIYQRVFGPGAEEACRRDHRDDVQRTFGWAFWEVQSEGQNDAGWIYYEYEEIDIGISGFAAGYTSDVEIIIDFRTDLKYPERSGLHAWIEFGPSTNIPVRDSDRRVGVQYRFDDGPYGDALWRRSSSRQSVYAWRAQAAEFVRRLLSAASLDFRVLDAGRSVYAETWVFDGSDHHAHPIRKVLAKSPYSAPGVKLKAWPVTCVQLNDVVEEHLGNQLNVGIYQRVFGDSAEEGCQTDHLDDVRSVFAWSFDTVGHAP